MAGSPRFSLPVSNLSKISDVAPAVYLADEATLTFWNANTLVMLSANEINAKKSTTRTASAVVAWSRRCFWIVWISSASTIGLRIVLSTP